MSLQYCVQAFPNVKESDINFLWHYTWKGKTLELGISPVPCIGQFNHSRTIILFLTIKTALANFFVVDFLLYARHYSKFINRD